MPFVSFRLSSVEKLSYWPVESGRFRVFRPMSSRPPTPTFRRFRAENAARHAAEISGDSRRKICEKVLKNSAGHFLKIFEKYFSEHFPFKIPKVFKVNMQKFSPRATRAALPSFPVKSLRISRGKC